MNCKICNEVITQDQTYCSKCGVNLKEVKEEIKEVEVKKISNFEVLVLMISILAIILTHIISIIYVALGVSLVALGISIYAFKKDKTKYSYLSIVISATSVLYSIIFLTFNTLFV